MEEWRKVFVGGVGAAFVARKVMNFRKRSIRSRLVSANDILVVGCGVSGICMGIKLQDAGLPFRIIEKSGEVGGTWSKKQSYLNQECDVPAHLYSFSFAQKKKAWRSPFAGAQEIREYLEEVFADFGLEKYTSFNCEMFSAVWQEEKGRWRVEVSTGETLEPKFLINGIGLLHVPNYPDVEGIDDFKGKKMHTAKFDHDYDFTGKDVVVVGSAASAVQVSPPIAKVARHLTVVQRTPNWIASRRGPVLPKANEYSPFSRWIYEHVPLAARFHRASIFMMMEGMFLAGVFNSNSIAQRTMRNVLAEDMLEQLDGNKEIWEKVVPNFDVGCKRILRTDEFLPCLLRENVELATNPLKRVGKDHIVVDNEVEERKIRSDVIVFATGFQVGSIGETKIVGQNGFVVERNRFMKDPVETYFGIWIENLPSMFFLLGPSTGLGHNSVILMIETQAEYIVRILCEAVENNLDSLEVKKDLLHEVDQWMDEQFDPRVWRSGKCSSWYLSEDGSKVVALWPGSTLQYFSMVGNAPGVFEAYNFRRNSTNQITSAL